jgi:hypothetical protein
LLVDRTPLSAFRVNLSRKSDSIITEIVQNIAQCRLVLADISTTGWSRSGVRRSRPIRNSNVMYELGIAHAARLPEEVIIVRTDADHLDFDIAGVRVHQYPADVEAAREMVQDLLRGALASIDQRRSIAVKKALQSLDPTMYMILQEFGDVAHPTMNTMGQALASAERRCNPSPSGWRHANGRVWTSARQLYGAAHCRVGTLPQDAVWRRGVRCRT